MSEKRITAGVVEMLAIIDDPTSTENERSMAATTIVEGVAPDILEAFVKATERERRLEDELTQWQQFASYCRCIEREYRELKLAVKAAGLRAVRVGEKLVVIGDSEPTPPAEPQTADADAWERASDELAGKIGWTDKPSEVERRAAIAAMTPSDEDFAFAETERLRTELTALREQLAAAERERDQLKQADTATRHRLLSDPDLPKRKYASVTEMVADIAARERDDAEAYLTELGVPEFNEADEALSLKDRITRLRAELAAAEQRTERILQNNTPWPLSSALETLIRAAKHLLDDHMCDQHGYEQVRHAMVTAELTIAALSVKGGA